MRNIANIITMLRIVLSLILLIVEPLSSFFYGLYIICGLSDILDGYIARILKITSNFGALLDSVADFVFVFVSLFIFLPIIKWDVWMIGGIICICIGRLLTLAIGYYKFREIVFYHTVTNKITGLFLFSFPFLYRIMSLNNYMILILVFTSISMIEEMIIMLKITCVDRNIKGLWRLKKNI